jgi:peptidoglycan/LPS O-acetylase OafA/YrhL
MDNHPTFVAILSMVIPIVAIIMGVAIGMLSLYLRFRRKRDMFQLYHTERMAAIEKGIELPSLPPEFFQDTGRTGSAPVRHRRSGLILLFLGIAFTVALWGTGARAYLWGLIPAAIGLALLVASVLEMRDLEKLPRAQGRPPVGP